MWPLTCAFAESGSKRRPAGTEVHCVTMLRPDQPAAAPGRHPMTKQYPRRFIDPRDQYRRWIDPRFRGLRTAEVVAYLRRHGWTEVPSDRSGFLVFQEPPTEGNEQPFCQFVPDFEDADDYPQRMFELLTGVAEAENRQASEVIDDILGQARQGQANGPGQELPRTATPAP